MRTQSIWSKVLSEANLRRLAGGASFARGEEYFAGGHVHGLVEHAGKLTAKVRGTHDYRVTLEMADGELDYACSCPVGADGAFCKHCVAGGLAWLAHAGERSPSSTTLVVTLEETRHWLTQQDKETLVNLILEQAARDDRLREKLLLQSAKTTGQGVNLKTFRQAIDRATDTGGFVDYNGAYDFAEGISEVVDSLEELLQNGSAEATIELAEYALSSVEESLGGVDDSDGRLGEMLSRLQELHLTACEKARPDPEALAERLFAWEMRTQWDTFYGAASTYADVLGEKGLAVYRQLAEAEWARVPALRAGQKDPEEYGRRFRITSIMESLARATGDIAAVVAIKQKNLSHPYSYLEIAEIYRAAKRRDEAMAWAERGLQAFPDHLDSRLREFLAEEYHRLKRHDEAMALIWAQFSERAGLENYQQLKRHADRIRQWPAWRDNALAFLRAEIAARKKDARKKPSWGTPDHSELVRIFLWEEDVESAWREAQGGGCANHLWMELAAKREKDFPADAIPIYQQRIDPLINDSSYEEAVKLLRKIRPLLTKLDRAAEFGQYLATLRATYKRKRNFMKLTESL